MRAEQARQKRERTKKPTEKTAVIAVAHSGGRGGADTENAAKTAKRADTTVDLDDAYAGVLERPALCNGGRLRRTFFQTRCTQ